MSFCNDTVHLSASCLRVHIESQFRKNGFHVHKNSKIPFDAERIRVLFAQCLQLIKCFDIFIIQTHETVKIVSINIFLGHRISVIIMSPKPD